MDIDGAVAKEGAEAALGGHIKVEIAAQCDQYIENAETTWHGLTKPGTG